MNQFNVLNSLSQRDTVAQCIAENVGAFDCWFGDAHVYHYDDNGRLVSSEQMFVPPDVTAVYVAEST